MTRRIVLAVLGLLAVVLGAITIPLGLLTAAQDRRDFSDETKFTAGTVANVAEEHLGDQASGSLLNQLVSALGERGDLVAVFGQDGVKVAGTARAPRLTARQLNRAQTAAFPEIYSPDDYVVVVTPIRKDSGRGNVGSVAVARPITSVDQRIATLWLIIGGVSAAGMLVAALVATGLASWVRRPLGALEDAAQLLGEGQLSTRSPADAGPREVRRLAANFNMMAGRLEALVHGHQATMADVSHQLRTPLSALRLRLELLAQDSDDIVASELAGAQEEIGRLSRLVSGLLAVARAENLACRSAWQSAQSSKAGSPPGGQQRKNRTSSFPPMRSSRPRHGSRTDSSSRFSTTCLRMLSTHWIRAGSSRLRSRQQTSGCGSLLATTARE